MTRRRGAAALVARVAAGVVALGLSAACGDDGGSLLGGGGDGYGEATERAFMRACVQDGGTEVRDVCACTYDEITRTIDFGEYRSIDRQVRDDPDDLPDEVLDIVADCGAAAGDEEDEGDGQDEVDEDG